MVDFVIDHLDPLGQGVSKRIDAKNKSTITFVPKTLPGEQGKAQVIKSAKGVEFAALISLSKTSAQRIVAECPHYARCSGCDYLHVSYADELAFKKSALLFLLRSFDLKEDAIDVIGAPERFGYRNRVQLHYRHKYLGLIDANSDQVLEIPQCKLLSPLVKQEMEQLYTDKRWLEQHSGRGHVELYEKAGEVFTEWNQPYASGGFSQVNSAMNQVLCEWLEKHFKTSTFSNLLDLFSGHGNLSDALIRDRTVQRQLVDTSPWPESTPAEHYLQLDLYDEEALPRFLRRATLKHADVLLLDPPRKGFAPLVQWSNQLKPKTIAYVSCNPVTLARDLQILMKEQKKTAYRISQVALLDMFPGTHHFETVVVLENR
jgi:23S rRNA (uracil1939-C5)-methyltransferase